MNTIMPSVEQEIPARPSFHKVFSLVITGAFVFLAVIAAIVAFQYLQPQQPWVEIIGKDLLRVTAPSKTIAGAKEAVIKIHQNVVVGKDGKRSVPSYQGGGRTWRAGPSPEEPRVKVGRSKTQIIDKQSFALSIELVSSTDAPTLVFIEYDKPSGEMGIVNDLVNELTKRGVKMRQ